MDKAVYGRDDVRVPVPVNDSGGDVQVPDQEGRGDDDGGAAHVQVLIGAGGDAGQVCDGEGAPVATGDNVQAPVDQRADVAGNIAEEGSAVLVLVGEKDDMTDVVEDQGVVKV